MAKKSTATFFFVLQLLGFIINAEGIIYDITKHGAKSNGDISKVLSKVWKEACASHVSSKIVIPKGTWQLSQVYLLGPNKAPIEIDIQGTIKAPKDHLPNNQIDWITIKYANNLEISGGGVLDGQGQVTWRNGCHKNGNCEKFPHNLSLSFINNTVIHDVTSKDSKNVHASCLSSYNVTFTRFTISAPWDSPNTDGIHMARSSNVYVLDSIIETGDDCVSIGDESKDIHVERVTCGPGHGISVGSLGKYKAEKDVKDIYVRNCTFKGTQNGVRVKTWPSGPSGLQVSGLQFKDLIMENVSQPVIIDQEYCPWNQCNKHASSLVKISNVTVNNVRGTSFTQDAMIFVCSKSHPCEDVSVSDIDLTYNGGLPTTTKCANIKPTLVGKHKSSIMCRSASSIP